MTDRMWARGYVDGIASREPSQQRVEWTITGSESTPLPSGLRPGSVLDFGTGRISTGTLVGDLVRSSARHIAQIAAVLPTTDAGNALVDELLRLGTGDISARRPLTRRTT